MSYGLPPAGRDPLTLSEAKKLMGNIMEIEELLPRLGLSPKGTMTLHRIRQEVTMQIARAVVAEDWSPE